MKIERRNNMRIMTFNLRCDFFLDFNNRWDMRKDIAINLIKKYNCEIIGTQEVTNKMHLDLVNNLDSPFCKSRLSLLSNNILVSKSTYHHS